MPMFQMPMFSRQSIIVFGNGKDEAGDFSMLQPDEAVAMEVHLMLWLGCLCSTCDAQAHILLTSIVGSVSHIQVDNLSYIQ